MIYNNKNVLTQLLLYSAFEMKNIIFSLNKLYFLSNSITKV